MEFNFSGNPRVFTTAQEADVKQMARFLLSQRVPQLLWREEHPYMLVDAATNAGLEPPGSKPEYGVEGDTCTVRVSG